MAAKWYTCTPVRFVGDQSFFSRDSGLLCKGFQEIGVECKAIMPGPSMDTDQNNDLIRTDYNNLEDHNWWQSLGGAGVVLYAWGDGKYLKIAKAIRRAGMLLVTHLDASGMFSIINGLVPYTRMLWRTQHGHASSFLCGIFKFVLHLAYGASFSVIKNDVGRFRHFFEADIIGVISPIAYQRIYKYCHRIGGNELASKLHLIPHPTASYMKYDSNTPKENLVIAAGRWDDEKTKGTKILKETCEIMILNNHDIKIEIYGKYPESFGNWHRDLQPEFRDKILLMGIVPNSELRASFMRARVELCTSLSESFHAVSAEALCCGASVVGPDTQELPAMKWFTTPYGTLATRTTDGLAAGVLSELKAWEKGDRIASEISDHWTKILHAPNVAKRILDLVGKL